MADRDIVTRAGKGSALSSTDYDQNVKSHDGTVEEQTGATYTVTYIDQNKTIELNNASMVCTMTAIATLHSQIDTDNFTVTLVNTNSTAATVNRGSTDTFSGGLTSITLAQNQAVTLQTDTTGAIWNIRAPVIINTNGHITTPFAGNLVDTNGNEVVILGTTASAVNEVTVTNAASAGKPAITQTGADDVGIDIEGVELHNGQGIFYASVSATLSGTIKATNTSTSGTLANGILGIGSSSGGYGVMGRGISSALAGVFGQHSASSGVTYGVEGASSSASGYDFYASGSGTNYGPFTGGHDGLVNKSFIADLGDIIKDSYILNKKNISNAIAVNELCTNNDTPIGVFTSKSSLSENLPAALEDFDGDLSSFDRITFNAVGEGCINVCGMNGNIESGDLIVCSYIAGKGMKQSDDIVRNNTVAKARESITFTGSEIKQIACIYLCG